jgi:uncharacterized alpha-E superfamily protein
MAAGRTRLRVASPPGRIGVMPARLGCDAGAIRCCDRISQGRERELFAQCYRGADEASVLNFFALDTNNPNSIRSCINSARTNAISLRHYISSEVWLDLNTLYLNAQEWTPDLFVSPGVFAFFADLQDSF